VKRAEAVEHLEDDGHTIEAPAARSPSAQAAAAP
jgi:hypothetical protein